MKSIRLSNRTDERGRPEWLAAIHEINGIDRIFGTAIHTEKWWAGGTVEIYEHARVIHRTDDSCSIVGLTERGDAAIVAAATKLNIPWHNAIIITEESK
jgi:hypothetical protein